MLNLKYGIYVIRTKQQGKMLNVRHGFFRWFAKEMYEPFGTSDVSNKCFANFIFSPSKARYLTTIEQTVRARSVEGCCNNIVGMRICTIRVHWSIYLEIFRSFFWAIIIPDILDNIPRSCCGLLLFVTFSIPTSFLLYFLVFFVSVLLFKCV